MDNEVKTQKAQRAFERVARNMVDGPLSMFYHDDPTYGRVYVAVGRTKETVEIRSKDLRTTVPEVRPWTGVWFIMVGESPFGQQINALPYFWDQGQIMADVLQQAKDPMKRFHAGGAFTEGWWRGGQANH